jgi:hypothetical protein
LGMSDGLREWEIATIFSEVRVNSHGQDFLTAADAQGHIAYCRPQYFLQRYFERAYSTISRWGGETG